MGDMEILHWLIDHTLEVLNAIGIIGGLLFTAFSFRAETKSRRVSNLLSLTAAHRSIWKEQFEYPKLGRVLRTSVNLSQEPISREEEIFVNLVVQHLNVVFHTMQDELTIPPEGLRRDVASFFSLPIPTAVWEKLKTTQNDRFVAYVDACRNWK